jgi:multiple antibiotic resistance protein
LGCFVDHVLPVFPGVFAIMNPIANTPVFVCLTADYDACSQRKIAAAAQFVSAVIIEHWRHRCIPACLTQ